MSGQGLLFIFILLSILYPLTLKLVGMRLDYQSGPVFISTWLLLGLLISYPFFGTLFFTGFAQLVNHPALLLLVLAKGPLLWVLFHDSLALAAKSVSAKSFTTPTALGFIVLLNSFFGEQLQTNELLGALGLFALGALFSWRGHLQELNSAAKLLYARLILITSITAVCDQIILSRTNWYILLLLSNLMMLLFCILRRTPLRVWRAAVCTPLASATGFIFTVRELLKFFLMVAVFPVSVVLSAQVATIPVVLVISALIWRERSWLEQALWGLLSVALLLLITMGQGF